MASVVGPCRAARNIDRPSGRIDGGDLFGPALDEPDIMEPQR